MVRYPESGRQSLGDLENGIPVLVERHGQTQPIPYKLKPKQGKGLLMIGIQSP